MGFVWGLGWVALGLVVFGFCCWVGRLLRVVLGLMFGLDGLVDLCAWGTLGLGGCCFGAIRNWWGWNCLLVWVGDGFGFELSVYVAYLGVSLRDVGC